MLTPQQLHELNRLIDQKIVLFSAKNISTNFLTEDEKLILKQNGVDISKIRPQDLLTYQSFAMGIASGAVPKGILNATSYDNFKKYISSGNFMQLNSYERAVLSSLQRQSLSDVKGIGERYKKTLEGALNSSERKYYEDTIRNKMLEGRAKKDSLRNISNDIAKELDAFGRDFDRIVQTVSHNAFTEGREAFFVKNYGNDARFYVDVYAGACTFCVQSYLTNGVGSQPKIFKVGELPPSSTNYGKKKANWVVTKPSSHPYCRCTTFSLPEGYVWDEEKKDFMPPKDFERKVERKSKVKVTWGDKEYEV
jgi:hypothetical protein